jgi:hypothetical protein
MYKRGCLPGIRATEVANDTTLSENVLEKGQARARLGIRTENI